MTRHIHADLIIAWAEGAKIEHLEGNVWHGVTHPSWNQNEEYRIAPKLPHELEQEAIHHLQYWQENTDVEKAHARADDVLCTLLTALGHGAVVEEYEKISKWYA